MAAYLGEGIHLLFLTIVGLGFIACFLGVAGIFDSWTSRLILRRRRRRNLKKAVTTSTKLNYVQKVDEQPFLPATTHTGDTSRAYFLNNSGHHTGKDPLAA